MLNRRSRYLEIEYIPNDIPNGIRPNLLTENFESNNFYLLINFIGS